MNIVKVFLSKNKWYVVIIACLILIFNMDALWVKILMQDDYANFEYIAHGKYPWQLFFKRDLLFPLTDFVLAKIMFFSPGASRLVHVLFFMIPCSLVLFFIYAEKLKIPLSISLLAVVAPQIHPGQMLIPYFLNGSYVAYSLLINSIIICYLTSDSYSSSSSYKEKIILFGLLIVAIEVSETSLFLLPCHFVLVFSQWVKTKNVKILTSTFIIFVSIGLYKVLRSLLFPAGANNVTHLSSNEMLDRIKMSVPYLSDLPFIFPSLPMRSLGEIGAIYIFFLFGFIYFFYGNCIKRQSIKIDGYNVIARPEVKVLFYSFTWFFFSLLPFLVITPYYASRHAYIAGFGWALFTYYLVLLPIKYQFKLSEKSLTIFGILYLILLGSLRINQTRLTYRHANQTHERFISKLSFYNLESNAQIVLTDSTELRTSSMFHWSSGYLKFLTGSLGINGLVGQEISNYDPFQPYIFTQNKQLMYGLDLKKPTYLFRSKMYEIQEVFYFFRWHGLERYPSWEIYKVSNEDRIPKVIIQQTQKLFIRDEVTTALKKINQSPKDVLWLDLGLLPH